MKKGHIGIGEKAQETRLDTGMHKNPCAITVLHEQWMCLGMQIHPNHKCIHVTI